MSPGGPIPLCEPAMSGAGGYGDSCSPCGRGSRQSRRSAWLDRSRRPESATPAEGGLIYGRRYEVSISLSSIVTTQPRLSKLPAGFFFG